VSHAKLAVEVDRLAGLVNELTLRCVLEGVPLPESLRLSSETVPTLDEHDYKSIRCLLPWTDGSSAPEHDRGRNFTASMPVSSDASGSLHTRPHCMHGHLLRYLSCCTL
jgi:hypothetical protein